jgi:hypothetical protein
LYNVDSFIAFCQGSLSKLKLLLYKKTEFWFNVKMNQPAQEIPKLDSQPKPKMVVIGSGGHGVMSLSELLKHEQYDHYIYFNTGDWGGSWGLWGRLLEYNGNELNLILHKQPLDVLPFADLNKAICHFVNLKNHTEESLENLPNLEPEKAETIDLDSKPKRNRNTNRCVLDFRSDKYSDHKVKIAKVVELVNFDIDQQSEFSDYFQKAWTFYQKNKLKLKYEKQFCVGYVLQFYVYYKSSLLASDSSNSLENKDVMYFWNKFWQDLEILPDNVYLDFTSKNRQVMTARDLSLEKLFGEDQIDCYYSPILPETMFFENPDETLGKPKKPFIKVLNQADLVIIPNGSVGNWLSVVNYQKVKSMLKDKKIVWLTNPYRNKNELINPNYVLYFNECGISVNTFVPSKNDQNPEYMNVLDQDKNGRYVPAQVAEQILKMLSPHPASPTGEEQVTRSS